MSSFKEKHVMQQSLLLMILAFVFIQRCFTSEVVLSQRESFTSFSVTNEYHPLVAVMIKDRDNTGSILVGVGSAVYRVSKSKKTRLAGALGYNNPFLKTCDNHFFLPYFGCQQNYYGDINVTSGLAQTLNGDIIVGDWYRSCLHKWRKNTQQLEDFSGTCFNYEDTHGRCLDGNGTLASAYYCSVGTVAYSQTTNSLLVLSTTSDQSYLKLIDIDKAIVRTIINLAVPSHSFTIDSEDFNHNDTAIYFSAKTGILKLNKSTDEIVWVVGCDANLAYSCEGSVALHNFTWIATVSYRDWLLAFADHNLNQAYIMNVRSGKIVSLCTVVTTMCSFKAYSVSFIDNYLYVGEWNGYGTGDIEIVRLRIDIPEELNSGEDWITAIETPDATTEPHASVKPTIRNGNSGYDSYNKRNESLSVTESSGGMIALYVIIGVIGLALKICCCCLAIKKFTRKESPGRSMSVDTNVRAYYHRNGSGNDAQGNNQLTLHGMVTKNPNADSSQIRYTASHIQVQPGRNGAAHSVRPPLITTPSNHCQQTTHGYDKDLPSYSQVVGDQKYPTEQAISTISGSICKS